jgi:hypothetical protein
MKGRGSLGWYGMKLCDSLGIGVLYAYHSLIKVLTLTKHSSNGKNKYNIKGAVLSSKMDPAESRLI